MRYPDDAIGRIEGSAGDRRRREPSAGRHLRVEPGQVGIFTQVGHAEVQHPGERASSTSSSGRWRAAIPMLGRRRCPRTRVRRTHGRELRRADRAAYDRRAETDANDAAWTTTARPKRRARKGTDRGRRADARAEQTRQTAGSEQRPLVRKTERAIDPHGRADHRLRRRRLRRGQRLADEQPAPTAPSKRRTTSAARARRPLARR